MHMRLASKLYFLTGFVILFSNCSNPEPVTLIRELPAFNQINLNSVYDVVLIQGTSHAISIVADENIVSDISLDVADSILSINDNRKFKWLNPSDKITLYITAAAINRVIAEATCSIRTMHTLQVDDFSLIMAPTTRLIEINLELDCNTFAYWNNYQCGGKVTLHGRTRYLNMTTFALMRVDAKDFVTDFAVVENNSKEDCEITVLEKLQYKIGSEGNVIVYGNPPEILKDEDLSPGELIVMD
jgi:hypothetical protein